MKLNTNIFRAYDIRGIAYEELSREVVIAIGKALGSKVLKQEDKSLIVARDGRNSSPEMHEWITEGIFSSGCNVIDIGIVPTPLLYFSTHKLKNQNGIMITGSHNPAEYNGFKIVLKNRVLSGESIQSIKKEIEEENFLSGCGKGESQDIRDMYLDEVKSNISLKKPLKIGIDCGNGASSIVAKECYEKIGCEVKDIYCELDGNFPNHHPDPSRPENLSDLTKEVLKFELDVGLAFDGDGDRLGVVSSAGKIIFPDMQMILFAENVIKEHAASKIVFDVKCSKLLPESIIEGGGIPIMSKTGHSFIKEKIKEVSAALGGEMSGHIFFNDRWPGFDDAIYAGARMLEIISSDPLGRNIFDRLPDLFSTPEINLKTEDTEKFKIVEEFKKVANFPEAKIIDIDGIRLEFENGWGVLRASNTSPVLVLRFEAINEESLEEIKDKFKKTLHQINSDFSDF